MVGSSVFCLCATLVVAANANVFRDYFTKPTKTSDKCWAAIDSCAARTLTTGRCKSTWGAFLLNQNRNDINANCEVSGVDFKPDVETFYDPNKDGQVCGDEWVARRLTYNGYSEKFLREEWVTLTTVFSSALVPGDAPGGCLSNAALEQAPAIGLKTDFANGEVARYVAYCTKDNNMDTDRMCLGLPVLCRDKRPDLAACRDLPNTALNVNTRSLKQKLDINMAMNDPNGDGTATVDEDWADISTFFDTDNDGCATLEEWIPRWTQFYGFSENHARAFYLGVNDGDGCVTRDDVVRAFQGEPGVPATFFPNLLIQIISGYCEANPSLYETDTDCAMVADTCRQFFPENPACQIYISNCGEKRYQGCVQLLTLNPDCRNSADVAEIHLEAHRTQNQILPGADCKDYEESCRQYKESKQKFMELFGYKA